MKIVHLCLSSFYIDNYSYQENMLPKYHVIQGHEVSVIASLVSFDSDGKPCLLDSPSVKMTKEGYKVIRLDYKRPFYKFNRFVRFYNEMYETLENEKPDLIFIHDFSFMDIRNVLKYLSRNKHVKVFVDCHTDYINSAKTWVSKNIFHHFIWRYYAKVLSPYVSMFYGVTPLRCDFLKEAYHIDESKVQLLLMGIDDDLVKTKDRKQVKLSLRDILNISKDEFVIVTGGKIDNRKNIHLVMKAIVDLSLDNVRLVVFGTIDPEMSSQFNDLLKYNKISFVGWLNTDQIINHFILADLIIFPGTHSVLWEQAVGLGVPCVFKYWKGMDHVDVGGNCKFLYDDDAEAIKSLLNKIILDREVYATMKNIAQIEGPKNFLYSEIAAKAINI